MLAGATSNLRNFSHSRGKIPAVVQRPSSAAEWAKKRAEFGQIDLIGGNGRWRQRLAEQVFERARAEDEDEQQRLQELAARRMRRASERAEAQRKYQEEEDQKWRDEQERKRKEREEKEEERLEMEAKDLARKKKQREEWEKRQPKPCQTCNATGICPVCNGVGGMFSTFLVSQVSEQKSNDYGRTMEGCTSCGGCKQGIRGDLHKGSGECAACGGKGKIWPEIAFHSRIAKYKTRDFNTTQNLMGTP